MINTLITIAMDNLTITDLYQNGSNFTVQKPGAAKIFFMYTIASLNMLSNIVVFAVVPRTKLLNKGATGVAMLNLAITDFILGLSCNILLTLVNLCCCYTKM